MGGARLEGLCLPGYKAADPAHRGPDPRRPYRRLASASHGGWAGSLLRHRADFRWGDRLNWVFNNAKGSVLIIMLMHAANNAVAGSFFPPMFSGALSSPVLVAGLGLGHRGGLGDRNHGSNELLA